MACAQFPLVGKCSRLRESVRPANPIEFQSAHPLDSCPLLVQSLGCFRFLASAGANVKQHANVKMTMVIGAKSIFATPYDSSAHGHAWEAVNEALGIQLGQTCPAKSKKRPLKKNWIPSC